MEKTLHKEFERVPDSTTVFVAIVVIVIVFRYPPGQAASVIFAMVGAIGISILVADPLLRIARAQRVAAVLAKEEEPF